MEKRKKRLAVSILGLVMSLVALSTTDATAVPSSCTSISPWCESACSSNSCAIAGYTECTTDCEDGGCIYEDAVWCNDE